MIILEFNPLAFNPGLTIWTFVIFLALLFLLSKFAWKPILNGLQKREDAIADSLNKAEQARNQAEQLIAQNKLERQQAELETQKAVTEGRAYAEKMRAELVKKAQLESEAMINSAREQIARDTKHAILQLRSEAADLAIMATSKLLDENLNDEKHRKVVDKMIAQLPTV